MSEGAEIGVEPAESRAAFRARCLAATRYVDSDSPQVRAFAERALAGMEGAGDRDRAVRLFEAVRDGIRYDPYSYSPRAEDYRASRILGAESAFCVPKAIALAACLRAAGIPAAPGFADVRNHLNSPRLADLMETDVFIYHGYVQLWLGERSFKITPAFNMALCERFGVAPLVFDGTADALFHPHDAAGRRHMEYLRDHGLFEDAPVAAFLARFEETYPRLHALGLARVAGEAAAPEDAAFGGRAARG